MTHGRRAGWACTGLLAVTAAFAAVPTTSSADDFRYDREQALGTSMSLVVTAAGQKQADAAHAAVVAEVGRLSKLLNPHDPQSELSKLNASTDPVPCSPELIEVLGLCETWRQTTGGAFNAQIGRVIEAWKQAEKAGKLPAPADLADRVAEANKPAVAINKEARTVRRLTGATLAIDAIAPGWVVDRALAAAAGGDGVEAVLLDIGGEIRAWRRERATKVWRVGVADPNAPADNAPLKARVELTTGAISTSGNYERYYTIAGKKHSYILDPKTGQTAESVRSSTAVAPDCATADALATALSVLPPDQGVRLVGTIKGAECFIIAANGKEFASPGWAKIATVATSRPADPVAKAGGWPAGFQMDFTFNLQTFRKRAYLAVWIEDAAGKHIKTLAVWGPRVQWVRQLTSFWKQAGGDAAAVSAITRATRAGGRYTLTWDGSDTQGKPVATGAYVVRMEVLRERAKRVDVRGEIRCGTESATGSIADNVEATDLKITYGKAGK